jgi:hypothetical protein
MGSANPPLAVHCLHDDGRRELCRDGVREAPMWLVYSPLPPFFLMLFTGLYMFVLPYAAKWWPRQAAAAARRAL